MNKNRIVLIAVIVIAVIIVAGAAVAMSNKDNDRPAPEPTGLSGTYEYDVAGSSTDPAVTYVITGTMGVALSNGTSSFSGISMMGSGTNPPGWVSASKNVPLINIGNPASSGIGQKNAMLNGAVFKETGTVDYDGSTVAVSIYGVTASSYEQQYYADASGVVYKVVSSDGTYTVTYTLTSISGSA